MLSTPPAEIRKQVWMQPGTDKSLSLDLNKVSKDTLICSVLFSWFSVIPIYTGPHFSWRILRCNFTLYLRYHLVPFLILLFFFLSNLFPWAMFLVSGLIKCCTTGFTDHFHWNLFMHTLWFWFLSYLIGLWCFIHVNKGSSPTRLIYHVY